MTDRPITIIAECGINHNGDMHRAVDMIWEAEQCGADVAKFQIYRPERILDLKKPRIIDHWDIIKATELSFENVCLLKSVCDKAQIEFFASVFHPDRVEWTEKIGVERYKIASRSIYNKDLAEAIAATNKPVIMSWGWYEPQKGYPVLINHLAAWGRTKHLYCIAEYPTSLKDLQFIDREGSIFEGDGHDGFSDHTVVITASVMAMSLGATIIEKHFTLSRSLPGCDQVCSMEPDELRRLCEMRNDVEEILYGDN